MFVLTLYLTLFGFPTFRSQAYLMKVNPEKRFIRNEIGIYYVLFVNLQYLFSNLLKQSTRGYYIMYIEKMSLFLFQLLSYLGEGLDPTKLVHPHIICICPKSGNMVNGM